MRKVMQSTSEMSGACAGVAGARAGSKAKRRERARAISGSVRESRESAREIGGSVRKYRKVIRKVMGCRGTTYEMSGARTEVAGARAEVRRVRNVAEGHTEDVTVRDSTPLLWPSPRRPYKQLPEGKRPMESTKKRSLAGTDRAERRKSLGRHKHKGGSPEVISEQKRNRTVT